MRFIFASAILIALVLVSGQISLNFQHHLSLPKEVVNKNDIVVSHEIGWYYPWVTKQMDVYLVDEITTYKQTQDVIIAINTQNVDKITFHLAGYGGGAEQTLRLINVIKDSKIPIVMRVEAPVYSAHAFLALSGTHLQMLPLSYLMLHNTGVWGHDCSTNKGMDRGITKVESCENFVKNHLFLSNTVILSLPVLTSDEKIQLLDGKEVYLDSFTVNSRLK